MTDNTPKTITFYRKLDYVAICSFLVIIAVGCWGALEYPNNVDEHFGKLFYAIAAAPFVLVLLLWTLFAYFRSTKQFTLDVQNQSLKLQGDVFYPLDQLDECLISLLGYRYKLKVTQSGNTVFATGHCYTTDISGDELKVIVNDLPKGRFHAWNKY